MRRRRDFGESIAYSWRDKKLFQMLEALSSETVLPYFPMTDKLDRRVCM